MAHSRRSIYGLLLLSAVSVTAGCPMTPSGFSFHSSSNGPMPSGILIPENGACHEVNNTRSPETVAQLLQTRATTCLLDHRTCQAFTWEQTEQGYKSCLLRTVAWQGAVGDASATCFGTFTLISGRVLAWGGNAFQQSSVPGAAAKSVIAIAAGYYHSLALLETGTVVAWGAGYDSQTLVPAVAKSGVVAVAAGASQSLALLSSGTVVAWGNKENEEAVVPPAAQQDVVAIAAGAYVSLALLSNGTVVAWWRDGYDQYSVPAAATSNVVSIAAGAGHVMALLANGTVVAWGQTPFGDTAAPPVAQANVTAIAAGYYHCLARLQNGTVVAWGYNGAGQTHVPPLSHVVQLAGGKDRSYALLANGTVVAWGNLSGYQPDDAAFAGVAAIAAGGDHVLAILPPSSPPLPPRPPLPPGPPPSPRAPPSPPTPPTPPASPPVDRRQRDQPAPPSAPTAPNGIPRHTPTTPGTSDLDSTPVGLIVGSAVGGAVGLALVVVACMLLCGRWQEREFTRGSRHSGSGDEGVCAAPRQHKEPVASDSGWVAVKMVKEADEGVAGGHGVAPGVVGLCGTYSTASSGSQMTVDVGSSATAIWPVLAPSAAHLPSNHQASSQSSPTSARATLCPAAYPCFPSTASSSPQSTTLLPRLHPTSSCAVESSPAGPSTPAQTPGTQQGLSTQGVQEVYRPGHVTSDSPSPQSSSPGLSLQARSVTGAVPPCIPWECLTLTRVMAARDAPWESVHKAMWEGRAVVTKVLRQPVCHSVKQAFRHQAARLCQLDHPQIARVHGVVDDGQHLALVMQYYRESSLYVALARRRYQKLSVAQRLELAVQVAEALSWLHERGIVHGRLTGSNLLLDDGLERLVIADTGLGLTQTPDSASADDTLAIVTAPEMLEDPTLAPSKAADVYAFAFALLEMVTAEVAYLGVPRDAVRAAARFGARPAIPDTVPTTVASVITACWAQDPADRPAFSCVSAMLRQGAARTSGGG